MGYLYFNSQSKAEISVPVVTYSDPGGLSFYVAGGRFRRYPPQNFNGETAEQQRKAKVNKVVLHHDGMSSARGCFNVLYQRRLSSHILIDRDGTVYQPLALQDVAFHVLGHNQASVGIDLNNPIRADRARRGLGGTVVSRSINGSVHRSLDYTDAQYESLAAVLDGLFQLFGDKIRREAPIGEDGRVVNRCLADPTSFSGIVAHWHLKASKWDPGPGFDWERLLVGVRASRVFYPVTLRDERNLGQVSKRKAPELAQAYFEHVEAGEGGFFPVGANQAWHTGAHFTFETPGAPVLAPAKGTIVVARNAKPRKNGLGSANLVVIRHKLPVAGQELEFYSVLTHLAFQPEVGGGSPLRWMKRLAAQPHVPLPDDPTGSAKGPAALRTERVTLLEVEVEAGEVVGHVGQYRPTDRDELRPVLDAAIISKRPLFPKSDRTFEVVDDDTDEGLMCNSRKVWRLLLSDPEVLDGVVRGGYPLGPSEVRDAYEKSRAAVDLRRLAVRHVTEWNPKTDLRSFFGKGVDFEWHAKDAAKTYQRKIREFLWWDDGVTEHSGLPADGLVYAYHPVALLTVLALGQARSAMEVGAGDVQQGLDDAALREQKRLEAAARREAAARGEIYDHEHVDTEGLTADEDLDAADQRDPEREMWMRWEQGEWLPQDEEE